MDTANPISPAKKSSTRTILAVAIVLGLIILLGVLGYFYKSSNKPVKNTTSPTPEASSAASPNTQKTEGEVLGAWGTVSQLTKQSLTIHADFGPSLTFKVDSQTKINKYQGATSSEAPKLLSDKASLSDLKVGDRVYVSTSKDLKTVTEIQANDILVIDWYVTSLPNE